MRSIAKNQGLQMRTIALNMTKIIVITYILTGVLLFIMALLMLKLDLNDSQINLGVIIVMIISTFIGGLIAAKTFKERRFIYGAIVGVIYFLVLLIISMLMHKDNKLAQSTLTMFLMCIGGGTIGGMLG